MRAETGARGPNSNPTNQGAVGQRPAATGRSGVSSGAYRLSKWSRGPNSCHRGRAPADRDRSPAFAGSVRGTVGVRLYRASGGRRAMKVWMIGFGAIVLAVAASAGGF